MDIINNNWIVTIVGGVASTFLFTVCLRYFFEKKYDKEYIHKIRLVNQEVIYTLRPGISEGVMPTIAIIRTLLKTTAEKHKVAVEDINSPRQIAEILIKEIMDSSFISAEIKSSYCGTLSHLIATTDELETSYERVKKQVVKDLKYANIRKKLNDFHQISQLILPIFVTIIAILIRGIVEFNSEYITWSYDITKFINLSFIIPTLFVCAFAFLCNKIFHIRRMKKFEEAIEFQLAADVNANKDSD
jgi:hypothetical protein